METILIGLLIPMAGIILGSSLVYLTKREMTGTLQKTLMGFAAGVMVSASFWSLLLPSICLHLTCISMRVRQKVRKPTSRVPLC